MLNRSNAKRVEGTQILPNECSFSAEIGPEISFDHPQPTQEFLNAAQSNAGDIKVIGSHISCLQKQINQNDNEQVKAQF